MTEVEKAGGGDAAYARLLRRSAAETSREMRNREMTEDTRGWGRLRSAVLGQLDQRPATVADIAARLSKKKINVICTLRRLEADGLASRSGTVKSDMGRAVTTWVRASDG